MTKQPLVSIIIPTFNRAYIIREALDSVLLQSYPYWECIIVDDGSNDNTMELLKQYKIKDKRFHYYSRPNQREKGANACRNFGFEKSSGEYLIFLDSDDFLENTCLEHRVNALTIKDIDVKKVCVFSMGLFQESVKSKTIFNKDFNNEKEYLKSYLIGKTPWTITCTFWPRNVFLNLGGFDESFKRMQDVEIHSRLLLKGYKIERVNYVDCWYRLLNDLKEYVNEKKLPTIIKAHIMYINKMYEVLKMNEDIITFDETKEYLKEHYIRMLSKYVFGKNLISFNEAKELNNKMCFLSGKKYFAFLLLSYYHKFNIKPKYGYYKLRSTAFS